MKKKAQPKKTTRSNVRRESEPLPWKFAIVTLVGGAALVAGFFYAAKTHFASINYCIRNAELKKQIAELESEKRRLSLAKEMALAPGELKKAARKLGLVELTAGNITAAEEPATRPTVPAAASNETLVRKTVDSKPVSKEKAVAADVRDRKVERSERSPAADTRERRVSKTGK